MRAEFPSLTEYLQATLTPAERAHVGLISFNQWTFALGAVAETALAAREIGSDVTVALWADETPLPDTGWRASRRIAHLLRSRTRDENAQAALLAAGMPASTFAAPPLARWRPVGLPALPEPLTRSRIRALRYRGSDMGRAILQVHPDDQTPIRESHTWPRRYVEAAMRSYAWAYDQSARLIADRGLTTVVVYNGRFTHDRAVADAAHAAGARVLYYDTGGYETDFDLTHATTHDWAHLQERMIAMYAGWDPAERDVIGSQWFTNRMTHADSRNRVFTGQQQKGHVEGVPEGKRIVAYFSSSGDEIAELDLDWSEYLHSQERALLELAAEVRTRPDSALVVRTHPHMRLKPSDDLADWESAVEEAAPDVHFGPTSPVDSYALMEQADIVFTYGSTSGVEAAFLGRPVVVMGPSAYDLLGCARRITSAEEIPECLDEPPATAPEKAIPYGLMMERRGFMFTRVQGRGEEASLAGVPLSEASELTLKVSDVLQRRRLRRLTRQ